MLRWGSGTAWTRGSWRAFGILGFLVLTPRHPKSRVGSLLEKIPVFTYGNGDADATSQAVDIPDSGVQN